MRPHFDVGIIYHVIYKYEVITKKISESKVLTKFRTNTADLKFFCLFSVLLYYLVCVRNLQSFPLQNIKISLIHSTARWRRPCIANPERRIDKGEHTHASFA